MHKIYLTSIMCNNLTFLENLKIKYLKINLASVFRFDRWIVQQIRLQAQRLQNATEKKPSLI
jgi:hypothetical protein